MHFGLRRDSYGLIFGANALAGSVVFSECNRPIPSTTLWSSHDPGV